MLLTTHDATFADGVRSRYFLPSNNTHGPPVISVAVESGLSK